MSSIGSSHRRHMSQLVMLLVGVVAGGLFSSYLRPDVIPFSFSPTPSLIAKDTSTCEPDPYMQPGMVYWGKGLDDVRWVTFPPTDTSLLIRTKDMDAQGREVWEDNFEALQNAVPTFTLAVRDRKDDLVNFAKGKIALFIGSSHDRANVKQWCEIVKGEIKEWGTHVAMVCRVKHLDLTLISWFLVGMVDSNDYDWFSSGEKRPLAFEDRIPEIMFPCMEEVGLLDFQPDLVVFSSLFWDESFLKHHGNQMKLYSSEQPNRDQGYLYEEINWHRSRVKDLIFYLREMFGEDVPLLYRTRQHRLKNTDGGVLKIAQLDQSNRAICKQLGVGLFTWGSKLEGYLAYDDKDQHFNTGPNTMIFGDMFMWYLRQTTNPGCWDSLLHPDAFFEQ